MKEQSYREIEENTMRKLCWRMAVRDDKKVAECVYEKKEMDMEER